MYGDETKPPADQVAGGDLMVRLQRGTGRESCDADAAASQGFYECLMSDLMSTRSKPMKPLTCTKKGKGGEPGLKVLVEEVRAVKGEAAITLWAKKLANRAGWFSTNTAYATLSKLREDGNWVLVARTPTMPKSASPMWPVLTVSMARLCNGDLDRPLRLAVEHQLTASTSSQVGFIDVPVNSLLRPNWSGELKHPRGKPKTCGTIKSMKPVIVERPTFVEYLQGGLEIGLCLVRARVMYIAALCVLTQAPYSLRYCRPSTSPHQTASHPTRRRCTPRSRAAVRRPTRMSRPSQAWAPSSHRTTSLVSSAATATARHCRPILWSRSASR
jgi:hypothetical protein